MKTSLKQSFITNENINDALFYNSLIEELNAIIENELSKSYEDINAEIIDDCCLALESIYSLQNGEQIESKNITNINSIVRKYNLQQRKKVTVACAAAAVLVFCMSTLNNSSETIAEGNIFKTALGRLESLIKNENVTEQLTIEPVSENTTEIVSEKTTVSQTIENIETNIKNIYVIVPSKTNLIFKSVEDINLSGVTVGVNYSTGETKFINISDCNVIIAKPKDDGETKISVSYKGVETCIYVTVLSEEQQNPVTLTSIYGVFENKYTIEDMQVFAVFSDGSETKINKAECKIQKEKLSDTNECIVTVSYGDCNFQFLEEGEVAE